jgi:hypothetical protein
MPRLPADLPLPKEARLDASLAPPCRPCCPALAWPCDVHRSSVAAAPKLRHGAVPPTSDTYSSTARCLAPSCVSQVCSSRSRASSCASAAAISRRLPSRSLQATGQG